MPRRHVIPVFVPHLGCPNSCVFCDQRRISGVCQTATQETVRSAIQDASFLKDDGIPKQLAFFGGSFTAIPVSAQNMLLDAAGEFLRRFPGASLRISTRPDCIDRKTLERLKHTGVTTIEIGAQSMDDAVLLASGRGHTAQDTENAAHLIREGGFELILQIMTGLPGDTPEKSISTARRIICLRPDGVRIYPTVVIRDTPLYDMWRCGAYREHTVEDAVKLCAEIVPMFDDSGVKIIRLGLNPTQELSGGVAAAGAYHPAFGELVYSRIFLEKARLLLKNHESKRCVTLGVAASRISVMTGQHKYNLNKLREEFGIDELRVAAADLDSREIVILCIDNKA